VYQAEGNDNDDQGYCHYPKDPLASLHVVNITGVHAQDACHGTKREKYDSDDSESVEGSLLAVFVGVNLLNILWLSSISSELSTRESMMTVTW
jgi:hypothetical protein